MSTSLPPSLSWPRRVRIVEVGMRDGLQNEPRQLATEDKARLAELLLDAGLDLIELTSFVHPRWIPQLADAERLSALIGTRPGVTLSALVPNLVGFERIATTPLNSLAVFISASEEHNQRNLRRSIDESMDDIRQVMKEARAAGLWCRGYVSMVWGSPYGDQVPLDAVKRISNELLELGVSQLSLGDTVGYADPASVYEKLVRLSGDLDLDAVSLHLHDTRGTGLANATAGMQAGVSIFDGSVGGLGGCPYARGASGNLATEDLVAMLHAMGIETGLDLEKLVDAAAYAEQLLGRKLPGKMIRALRGPYPGETPTDVICQT